MLYRQNAFTAEEKEDDFFIAQDYDDSFSIAGDADMEEDKFSKGVEQEEQEVVDEMMELDVGDETTGILILPEEEQDGITEYIFLNDYHDVNHELRDYFLDNNDEQQEVVAGPSQDTPENNSETDAATTADEEPIFIIIINKFRDM
jgi:hypothetical protein